jgi:hypothetical protein
MEYNILKKVFIFYIAFGMNHLISSFEDQETLNDANQQYADNLTKLSKNSNLFRQKVADSYNTYGGFSANISKLTPEEYLIYYDETKRKYEKEIRSSDNKEQKNMYKNLLYDLDKQASDLYPRCFTRGAKFGRAVKRDLRNAWGGVKGGAKKIWGGVVTGVKAVASVPGRGYRAAKDEVTSAAHTIGKVPGKVRSKIDNTWDNYQQGRLQKKAVDLKDALIKRIYVFAEKYGMDITGMIGEYQELQKKYTKLLPDINKIRGMSSNYFYDLTEREVKIIACRILSNYNFDIDQIDQSDAKAIEKLNKLDSVLDIVLNDIRLAIQYAKDRFKEQIEKDAITESVEGGKKSWFRKMLKKAQDGVSSGANSFLNKLQDLRRGKKVSKEVKESTPLKKVVKITDQKELEEVDALFKDKEQRSL